MTVHTLAGWSVQTRVFYWAPLSGARGVSQQTAAHRDAPHVRISPGVDQEK